MRGKGILEERQRLKRESYKEKWNGFIGYNGVTNINNYEKEECEVKESAVVITKCTVCENDFYCTTEYSKKKCIKCINEGLYKCKDCGSIFCQPNKKRNRNQCRECYNKYQKERQRKRASTLYGHFRRSISNMKNKRGKRKGNVDVTIEQLIDLYHKQDGKCAISGIEMQLSDHNGRGDNPFIMSVDRIDSGKSYTIENIQLVIYAVNMFKGKCETDVLFFITKQIYEKHQLDFMVVTNKI